MNVLKSHKTSLQNIHPNWFLVLGIVLTASAHMSFSMDIFGWVANVPFLLYLHVVKGWKSRLLFVFALIMAWSFAVLKIVSPPMPYVMVFLFSVPISLFHLPAYLIWDKFKAHKWSALLFPSVFIIMEWIQYTFTPFASWGVSAYSQSHSLILMQSVSVFGIAGLSFFIYWINSSLAHIIIHRKTSLLATYLPATVLFATLIFGACRFEFNKSKGVETITVSAAGTDSEINGLPLPSSADNEKDILQLFERTRIAGKSGAKLVVWNEGSFYVLPEDETLFSQRLSALAKELQTAIVAAYVVPLSETEFRYRNKYLLVNENGEVIYSYLKHEPVPGEPAEKGKEKLQVFNIENSKIGGAICYDYDFPYLAKGFGDLNADIVTVPSSDWRGIDPLHTRMAAFRAIEQGHSVLRSTRFGLSAGITPFGEMTSQMSSFDRNNRIMISHLPAKRVPTLYAVIGDVLVYACTAFVFVFLVYNVWNKKKSAVRK